MSVAWLAEIPATEKMVLLALADAANDDGVTWMAIRSKRAGKLDFIRKTSLSERAIQTAMKRLEERSILHREFRDGKGTIYTIDRAAIEGCISCGGASGARTPARRAPKPSIEPNNIQTRARRQCPEGWEPTELDAEVGRQEGLDPAEITRCLAMFKDHTFGASRVDWSATFRNWLRKAGDQKRRDGRFSGAKDTAYKPPSLAPRNRSAEGLARLEAIRNKRSQ